MPRVPLLPPDPLHRFLEHPHPHPTPRRPAGAVQGAEPRAGRPAPHAAGDACGALTLGQRQRPAPPASQSGESIFAGHAGDAAPPIWLDSTPVKWPLRAPPAFPAIKWQGTHQSACRPSFRCPLPACSDLTADACRCKPAICTWVRSTCRPALYATLLPFARLRSALSHHVVASWWGCCQGVSRLVLQVPPLSREFQEPIARPAYMTDQRWPESNACARLLSFEPFIPPVHY